ncbi:DUF6253 family protein [Kitasatospora sp. NPDC056138]|uniref:DUF6253 family protein n=1 Tax=Kitasatospora sp. NPDC056138 TaxID=3345724 RepID=UPI0035DC4FF3
MSLLDAHGYEAVFGTPEGDTYRIPLVCWREDGDHVYGMVLTKGHLRRTDQLRNFLQYDHRHTTNQNNTHPTPHFNPPPFNPPATATRPDTQPDVTRPDNAQPATRPDSTRLDDTRPDGTRLPALR